MLYVRLTDEQRAELEDVSRQAVGRVALRAQMVLLSARRYSVPQIAAIQGCGQDVVRGWLHRYEAHGVAGLEDRHRSGRPPKGRLARQIVDAQASQAPRCVGLVQSCWTVALLACAGRLVPPRRDSGTLILHCSRITPDGVNGQDSRQPTAVSPSA